MTVSIGVDVSARDCAVASYKAGKLVSLGRFPQTPQGHQRLAARLMGLSPSHVVMEATGIYHLDLAIALDRAGLPVSVINPRSAKRFAQLKLQGSKTDEIDAGLLAHYGDALRPPRWWRRCRRIWPCAIWAGRSIDSRRTVPGPRTACTPWVPNKAPMPC